MALAIFGGFLVSNEIGIADSFGFDFLAVHEFAQLAQEHVKGATVENQMVDIGQEINLFLGFDDFHAVQRPLFQIEWLNKLRFVFFQFRFT